MLCVILVNFEQATDAAHAGSLSMVGSHLCLMQTAIYACTH